MGKKTTKRKSSRTFSSATLAQTDPRDEAPRQQAALRNCPASWNSSDWLWGLILVLAVLLAYSPVWWAGYIWDDDNNLTANPCIIGPLGFKEIWTTSAGQFYPLLLTTFWVEHALWGLAPLPYHLVNVFLHGGCAVLLWRVLRSLEIPGAWLGAALWALHPVEVESVAWVSEMKNTQSCLFFLLAILFFVRWLKARNSAGRAGGGWDYAWTLLFAALAMASKSSTVILPVVLCLCAWWVEGRWRWRNLARVAPIFLMSAVASALSIWVQKQLLETNSAPTEPRTWPERLASAGDVVWFYLGKLLWPHPLMTVYPRWHLDAGQSFAYLPSLAVVVVLLILWFNRNGWARSWFFAFGYFVAALLPVLGFADQPFWVYSFVADYFQYLASMGPLALAGAGLVRLVDVVVPGKPGLQSILGVGILTILGLLTWQRAWAYESEETLWTDALAKNPDCWVGCNNLGYFLFKKGRVDEAMAQYQKALEINPDYADAHNNLGAVLLRKGQLDDAMAQYQKALEINPDYAEAHNNLGSALLRKGRMDEAMAQFQKAVGINPNYANAHANLGSVLAQKGQLDEAMAEFRKALEIDPNLARARANLATTHANLGLALAQKGQLDEAIVQFQEALRLKPDFTGARNDLARTQAMLQSGTSPP